MHEHFLHFQDSLHPRIRQCHEDILTLEPTPPHSQNLCIRPPCFAPSHPDTLQYKCPPWRPHNFAHVPPSSPSCCSQRLPNASTHRIPPRHTHTDTHPHARMHTDTHPRARTHTTYMQAQPPAPNPLHPHSPFRVSLRGHSTRGSQLREGGAWPRGLWVWGVRAPCTSCGPLMRPGGAKARPAR